MSDLFLHNTLTRKKEPFAPIKKGEARLYVSGNTPYDETHLCHARFYVVFDVLRRVLRKNGVRVRHIQNFTDVDDKIIDRAKNLNVPHSELSKKYEDLYFTYMDKLNVERADAYPHVTEKMDPIKKLIAALVARGFAYVLDGSVYYSVRKFNSYGKLSGRKIDELEAGARVEVDERKKDPLDFALWKAAKPGEPAWDSPWGAGRPGWHIECSAMSIEALGEEFDIHGGGMDLIFPHHENEIAQSEGATGKSFAKVWVHNGFVTVNKEKMSKSLGNFFTLREILEKFDPMVVRYFLLSQHYRGPLNFSDQELRAAETVWTNRICGATRIVASREKSAPGDRFKLKPELEKTLNGWVAAAEDALNDDLNTAAALAALNDYCSSIFALEKVSGAQGWDPALCSRLRKDIGSVTEWMGLKISAADVLDSEVADLLRQREAARKAKDWRRSDEIRKKLQAKGVTVEDTPAGPRVKKTPSGVK